MYFADFDSFEMAKESAKAFSVVVELVDGDVKEGSSIPAPCYNQIMADIATCDELKTAFALWSRGMGDGDLTFIPYDKIKSIRVRFIR